MDGIVSLEVALETDAEQIRNMMVEIERDETDKWYEKGERPFIPGYDSIDMQKYHMWDEKYYKIIYDEILAGILLISYTGKDHARIDRFYIYPIFQGKGIGSKVITLIEEIYHGVKIWTLDTTQKSIRNHIFYEKNGYKKIGEDEEERYYCKVIGEPNKDLKSFHYNKDFSNENFSSCNMEGIDIYDVNMSNSRLTNMNMERTICQNTNLSKTRFTNVNMSGSVLGDANMNKIEICHISLGEAYIHDTNLGFKGEKAPLRMERCELSNSSISDSNLRNLSINNCDIEGMKIDGILVSELINLYNSTVETKDDIIMKKRLLQSHSVFPTQDIISTSEYYEKVLGFKALKYLEALEPHICLYRDDTEIILTLSEKQRVVPNRELYGYGYDAYFITKDQQKLQQEFLEAGAKIVRPLSHTDYQNKEFVVEDIDGRWIGFGIKEKVE